MDTGALFAGLCALDVVRMTRDSQGEYRGFVCDADEIPVQELVLAWVFATVFNKPTVFTPAAGATGVSVTPALACREGVARPFVLARRDTVNQLAIGNNTDLIFNAVSDEDIFLNATTGVFTLKAGVEYELTASPNLTNFSSTSGYAFFRWVFASDNTPLPSGGSGSMIPSKNTAGEASQPVAKATYRQTVDTDVKLRVWQAGTGTFEMAVANSWATVQTTATRYLDYTRSFARFQIRKASTTPIVYDSGEFSEATIVVDPPLMAATQYEVRVQHRDLYTGQLTNWSDWQGFTTA